VLVVWIFNFTLPATRELLLPTKQLRSAKSCSNPRCWGRKVAGPISVAPHLLRLPINEALAVRHCTTSFASERALGRRHGRTSRK